MAIDGVRGLGSLDPRTIYGEQTKVSPRTSFGEQIKRNGLDSLIAELVERNRKGDVELPPSAITKPVAQKNAL